MQTPDTHEETGGRQAFLKGCWEAVRAIYIVLLVLVALAVLFVLVWRAIGGPAYLECMVSTVDASECHFFE